MAITLNGTTGITTPDIASTTSTLGSLTQALDLGSTGQIVFPATQNASSNANTLDDYEEGTWTPVLTPGSGSITSQSSYGYYTKIGNSVTVLFAVRVVTGGTASGVGYLSGFPFTSQTVSPTLAGDRAGTVSIREDGLTGNWYFGYVWSNNTQMTVTTSTNQAISYSNTVCYVASFVYRSAT